MNQYIYLCVAHGEKIIFLSISQPYKIVKMGSSKNAFMYYRQSFNSKIYFKASKIEAVKKKNKSMNTDAPTVFAKVVLEDKVYHYTWEETYLRKIEVGSTYLINGNEYIIKTGPVYNRNGLYTNNSRSRFCLAEDKKGVEFLLCKGDLTFSRKLGSYCEISKRRFVDNVFFANSLK